MGYSNDHYNYQVAVIFAILLGALLLLGLVLGGIYLITKSMRDDGKDKSRRPASGRNSAQWPSQAPSYRAPSVQEYQPQAQQQTFDFAPRSPGFNQPSFGSQPNFNQSNVNQGYSQPPIETTHISAQYSQPPLVTPVSMDYNRPGSRVQQPDVIYTQGPTGFVRTTPVEYAPAPAFHQSSV